MLEICTPEEVVPKVAELLATPDSLQKWLNGCSVSDKVGERCTSNRCPLAVFLQENIPGYIFYVGSLEINYTPEELTARETTDWRLHHPHTIGLPQWAYQFVRSVDNNKTIVVGVIQAKKALATALGKVALQGY